MRLAVDGSVGINESVPVGISLSEKSVATNCLVVGSCVGSGWVTTCSILSANRPSSLSNDNWLSLGSCDSDIVGIVEERRGVLDGVVLGDLEVWEGVHSQEIGLVNHGRVGTVSPDIPGIDVSNCHLAQASACNCLPDLLDVFDQIGWLSSNTERVVGESSGRDTVQILGSDRDTVDTACELLAVLLDGRCESCNLVVHICLSC